MVQWRKLKGKDLRNEPLHRWLARFDRNSTPELIEEVAAMDSTIAAVNDKLNRVMEDEETRRIYWRRELAIMDRNAELEFARNEGLAKGREQSAVEITLNLRKIGLSVTQIVEVTGLSPDAIEKL